MNAAVCVVHKWEAQGLLRAGTEAVRWAADGVSQVPRHWLESPWTQRQICAYLGGVIRTATL